MSSSYSIGFIREDGDFQILAALNNKDDLLSPQQFHAMIQSVQRILARNWAEQNIVCLEREDIPDYVALDLKDVNLSYEVQTEMLGGWENCWTDGGNHDKPLRFATREEAEDAIKDHIADCINAVEGGDMLDSPDPSNLRVVEVKS